jgi:hypothetical protein
MSPYFTSLCNKHLVLAYHYRQVEWVRKEGLWPKFGECSLVFVLQPTNDGGTRLLVRTRFTLGGLGVHLLWWPFFEIGDFFQQWRMLPGIKRRAESLSGSGSLHSVGTPR